MREKISFEHNDHITKCFRKINNKTYIGEASCHPDDFSFESNLIGEHYAYTRSLIEELKEKKNILKIKLVALNNLQQIFLDNKIENEATIHAEKQIHYLKRDIEELESLISTLKEEIKADIKNRDLVHKKLQEIRSKHE